MKAIKTKRLVAARSSELRTEANWALAVIEHANADQRRALLTALLFRSEAEEIVHCLFEACPDPEKNKADQVTDILAPLDD